MFRSVDIRGFRQFREFKLTHLNRVNLLVGRNNAGKTTVLEAIEMLALGGRVASLQRSLRRRGEFSSEVLDDRTTFELDVRHLFYEHTLQAGAVFAIHATTDDEPALINCSIQNAQPEQRQQTLLDDLELDPQLELRLSGFDNIEGSAFPLTPGGTIVSDPSRRLSSGGVRAGMPTVRGSDPVVFLGTEGADANTLHQIWDSLVLTPEEVQVTAAMKLVEPSIERLAFARRELRSSSVAFVKLKDAEHRVPLDSFGDGTRRLLALAIFLARATGGVLLVDEIDTGLHYTALESMWRFVVDTARRLDVQVFATSHSGDCIRALAWLQSDDPALAADVTVHRIEKGQTTSVAYSAVEIETAARHHVEVRG